MLSILQLPALGLKKFHCFFIVGLIVVLRSSVLSVTVPLHRLNNSGLLHPNGSLYHVGLDFHIQHIKHRYCLRQQTQRMCRRKYPALSRRINGQVSLDLSGLGAAPMVSIQIGGQALSVTFDTAALVTVVDSSIYNPHQSPSAFDLASYFQSRLPDGRISTVARWNDFMSITGIHVRACFDRSEERVFESSATTAANGLLAFSRYDQESQNPAPPIYEMLAKSLLDWPIFAFSLARTGNSGTQGEIGGQLSIGTIDHSAYHGRLSRSVFERGPRYQGLWAIRGTINSYEAMMILDTGASLIFLPMRIAGSIFADWNMHTEISGGALIAKYECTRAIAIAIKIGERSTVLRRSSIQFGDQDNGWCMLSIVGNEQEEVTLGRPFFESVYTTIDLNGRLSLGAL
ncbi:hypothetical protein V8E36_001679 [Tilletia maclaganii]